MSSPPLRGGRALSTTTACCCSSVAMRHGHRTSRVRAPPPADLQSVHAAAGVRSAAMRLIGVTGGIATGKSTVDRLLAARGAIVIDADELAREAVRPGELALDEVA